jgi:hypothetical protein
MIAPRRTTGSASRHQRAAQRGAAAVITPYGLLPLRCRYASAAARCRLRYYNVVDVNNATTKQPNMIIQTTFQIEISTTNDPNISFRPVSFFDRRCRLLHHAFLQFRVVENSSPCPPASVADESGAGDAYNHFI